MQLSYRALSVCIALSLMVLTGCGDKDKDKTKAEQAKATQTMPLTTVDVQVVNLGDVPIVAMVSGRMVASETSEVRPQVSGIVEEILFQEGGVVQAGQPLYRINTESYTSSVAANEATLNQAQANVGTAKAALLAKQAQLEQAQVDLARLEGLIEIDAISRQAYDQAVTAVKTAQAGLEQAHANLESAQALVYSAQAKLDASRLELNRTIIRAPISGKVGISSVTKGALVSAGQPSSLVTISSYHPIYVDISQSSADLLRLREALVTGRAGMGSAEVELELEDGSTYPIKGQLMLSNAKVNESTGTVTLRAIVANPEGLLLPGMFVNARIDQQIVSNAVLLPQTALIRTAKGETQVYVVNQDKKIEPRQVVVSGTHSGQWVVTGGVQTGDNVVVLGANKVKPEQMVEVRILPAITEQPIMSQVIQADEGASQVAQQAILEPKPKVGEHSVLAPKKSPHNDKVAPIQNSAQNSTDDTPSALEQEMMDMADSSQ